MTDKLVSEVKGVHYTPSHKCWMARNPHKKVLYRGKSKQEAEQARKLYDAGKRSAPQASTGKRGDRDRFPDVKYIDWPATTWM